MNRKSMSALACLACMIALVSVGAREAAAAAGITLRFAHVVKPTEIQGVVADAFAKEVAQRTQGEVRVAVYPSSQLGGERDIIEGLKIGTIDFFTGGIGIADILYPPIDLLGLPYLFRDEAHYRRAVAGAPGRKLLSGFDAVGLKGLGLYSGGFRHVLNSKRPVNTLADLRGLKLRLREIAIEIETFKALGAVPVPIPWPEVYTSVQTGVVDGLEHSLFYILSAKLYEVAKYVSLTAHVHGGKGLLMSMKKFTSLSAEHQRAIVDSAEAVIPVGNNFVDQMVEEAQRELPKRGAVINTVSDLKPFKQAVIPVYEKFLKKQPEWVREVVREMEGM